MADELVTPAVVFGILLALVVAARWSRTVEYLLTGNPACLDDEDDEDDD